MLRKRIILSQIVLFVAFIAVLFPFIDHAVTVIVRNSLEETAADTIDLIDNARSEKEMIELLKKQEFFSFFRMGIINEKREIIYDSHVSRINGGETYQAELNEVHPEVEEAFKDGSGFNIAESKIFGGKFAYVAQRFVFQGNTYVLRAAFPYSQLQDLTHNFQLGFIAFSFLILLFFNIVIWIIFSYLTKPIGNIIDAIEPYQKGEREDIPTISLGRAPDDEFERLASTLNSLSQRVQSQIQKVSDERNEKEAILESLGEGVIAVDAKLQVTYINYIGSKMLNIPRRQLQGKPFPVHFEKAPEALLQRCIHLLRTCQQQNTILTDSLALGGERKVYIDLIAAPKADAGGAIIVLQDKSSHHKVVEMGKDFVANASHELRTPITIIKGFAETLQDLPEMSHEMLADITEKIVRNCQRMDNLVKNLLRLADIENIPESRFKESNLITLAENCRHMVQSIYPTAEITIEKTSNLITVSADSDLLELALTNLLDNAAKYSKPPAKISIKITPFEEDEVQITITDQGIGIPPEDLEHIFERFYTVDKARSRKLGGAGLGLSIVKNIIEKHDGTISATSTVGKGTTFTIILPRHRHIR